MPQRKNDFSRRIFAIYIGARRRTDKDGIRDHDAEVVISPFVPGEAFQFDWSHEYVVLGGVNRVFPSPELK